MAITYVVSKAARLDRQPADVVASPWLLFAYPEGAVLGTRLGLFKTRKEAVTTARLLAGWRHKLEIR